MPTKICDILIQAGHENTPDGATGGEGPLGNEIDWTPIVANEAVAVLRAAGVDAVKEDASIKHSHRIYQCKLATFVHFDDPDAGESGPSVGYPHDSDREAATEWKALYSKYWPYNEKWHPDNYTDDEHFYYGYSYTVTSDAEFLIEFGDLGSLRQAQWIKPRLHWLGKLLAHFLSQRSGLGAVPDPGPFVDDKPDDDQKKFPKFILQSTILSGHLAVEEVAAGRRVLRATSERVDGIEFVQDGLNALAEAGAPALGISLGAYRGYFGSKTVAAVRAFQTDRGIEVDGAVGSETILALDAALLELQPEPKPFEPDGDPKPGGPPLAPKAGAKPVGTPAAFSTNPSKGTFNGSSSKTTGLDGVGQRFDDGTLVNEATETLTVVRNGDSFGGPRRVTLKQVRKGKAMTVEQADYCWRGRDLPHAILIEESDGIAKKAPKGFTAQPIESGKSTQFGKFDSIDEGTGSEVFGVTQTNSDVFGASVKKSRLIDVFGPGFATDPKRLGALVEIYHPATRRYACVPLVDIGPRETLAAQIDLTFALDRFLKTEGELAVDFRIIVP